jgi:NADP-dependent 3-hydroxy acid dehydrogenase YdfG
MGRSLSAEHGELWGGLIDLASGAAASTLAAELERELHGRDGDDQVAWRDGRRYAPRLVRRAAAEQRGGMTISAEGAYLVTGGLGGIGLAAAGWLVSRGARRLLLVGRTALPPREQWPALESSASADARRIATVRRLEASGARVETAALDVAVDGALADWLGARRERGEPGVRGVIHAAGVLDFRALSEQDASALRSMLAPKIAGAWQLHLALGPEPLDWFVACSSTSSLLRSPLLGAYAAGNAFLDSLAHHRRALGLPALSINWGTWGEVGMAISFLGRETCRPTNPKHSECVVSDHCEYCKLHNS